MMNHNVCLLKEIDLHLAFGPPGLLPTAGEPGVEPIESALRLADRVTRIHGWPTLIYSLAVPAEDLEKLAAALGISHREGPRLDPETLEGLETLLNGLVEWVRERGLKLLIVDASHADPDELEVLVPLLRYFSTEWPIYTVLFVPAKENGDGR